MGVPKFYRWLSERYPCLSEVVKEQQIPEFDNLYLDMNGIIHICSHPNDDDVHFRISEEKIIRDIFHYIEVLFRMIQPRKVFFMAIDGVAPRAKMNQQRGRRFRSAKEAELNERRAKDRGEELPKEARFDSNCITPGTSFMHRLHQHLKYFVTNKISTDALWEGVNVILSGHETPGEGEHKIMDFIRHERSKPDYDPNTRHCLYGLDADLMMLGMCTHDPHFSLLREEVRFNGKKNSQKRVTTPEETTFHLLHLSLLREYLELEFSTLKTTLPFPYDVESIIDDWILLGFLIGNDFLPNLPHLHINKGALSELYDVYKEELPKLGGYINSRGTLHLKRFEQFLSALALREMDRFEEIYSDNKWLEGKTAKRTSGQSHGSQKKPPAFQTIITDTPGPASVEEILMSPVNDPRKTWTEAKRKAPASAHQQDLLRLINSVDQYLDPDVSENDDTDVVDEQDLYDRSSVWDNQYHIEFRQYKREYYVQKLGYAQVTPAVLQEQAEVYVRAIQWNLHYYYNGCKSWSWYYPHHFAPWISDIKGFSNMVINFDLGEPFLPFEQLLSVLPAASKELLPKPYQILMTSESSPIIDFYPVDFDTDLNGKQQEWEAVVLIPFIQEEKLKEAMAPYKNTLTEEEKSRNRHGPMQSFGFTKEDLGSYPAFQYFPPISKNRAKKVEIWREEWEVPENRLRKGLLQEVRLDVFFPGFPTLKHIPHTARLDMAGVRVFEQASRGLNMILSIVNDMQKPQIDNLLQEFLGKEIWVSWPHMIEAKVVTVIDENYCYSISQSRGEGKLEIKREKHDDKMIKFSKMASEIADNYKNRWGISIGKTQIILLAQVLSGRKYVCGRQGKITLEKQWSKTIQPFALQATRKDILVHDPSFTQYRTLPELFSPGSTCFSLMYSFYGAQGIVKEISPKNNGKITIVLTEHEDVDLTNLVARNFHSTQHYFQSFVAAKQLGIKSYLFSRITGSMFVQRGPKEADHEYTSRLNIGLNLKINKKNEEVSGFTKRGDDNNWLYSMKTVMAVKSYMSNFPEIFDFLDNPNNLRSDSIFHHGDIFTEGNGEARLRELTDWMSKQPFSSAARQSCGTLSLDESVVAEIERMVEKVKEKSACTVTTVHALPYLVYKPNLVKGGSLPDPETTFLLLDRVVNIRLGFSVPLGLKGTITGILKGPRPEEDIIEVLFDSEFSGGLCLRSSSPRSYRLPGSALINITHGQRLNAFKNDTMKTLWSQMPTQGQRKPEPYFSPLKSEDSKPSIQSPDPKDLPDPMALFKNPDPMGVFKNSNSTRTPKSGYSKHTDLDKEQHPQGGKSWKQGQQRAPNFRGHGRNANKGHTSASASVGKDNQRRAKSDQPEMLGSYDKSQELEEQLKAMLNINSKRASSEGTEDLQAPKPMRILKRPQQLPNEPVQENSAPQIKTSAATSFVPLQVHMKQSVKGVEKTKQASAKPSIASDGAKSDGIHQSNRSSGQDKSNVIQAKNEDFDGQPKSNDKPRKIRLAAVFPLQLS